MVEGEVRCQSACAGKMVKGMKIDVVEKEGLVSMNGFITIKKA